MKRKYLLTLLLCFIPFIKADAGVSVYPNYSTVTKGSTVTFIVKLTDAAAWSIKGSSSGATNGCSINEADTTSDGNNALIGLITGFAEAMESEGFDAKDISMGSISGFAGSGEQSISEKTLYQAAVSLVRGLAKISG